MKTLGLILVMALPVMISPGEAFACDFVLTNASQHSFRFTVRRYGYSPTLTETQLLPRNGRWRFFKRIPCRSKFRIEVKSGPYWSYAGDVDAKEPRHRNAPWEIRFDGR